MGQGCAVPGPPVTASGQAGMAPGRRAVRDAATAGGTEFGTTNVMIVAIAKKRLLPVSCGREWTVRAEAEQAPYAQSWQITAIATS